MAPTPDCLTRLQLKQDPFAADAGDVFIYTDTLLESLREMVLNALAEPNSIVLLSGAAGSGRSVQLMQILSILPTSFDLIAFRGRRNTTFAAVELTIRNHLLTLGIDAPESSLRELLGNPNQPPVNRLIAIDDAHLLGADIIRQLLRLRSDIITAVKTAPSLLLVGTSASAHQYTNALEPDDVNNFKRIQIRSFNLEQTRSYLIHRLRMSGCDTPDAWLKPMEVAQLFQRSEGLPAAINTLATEWLIRLCRNLEKAAAGVTPAELLTADEVTAADSRTTAARSPTAPDGLDEKETPARGVAFWRQRWFVPVLTGLGMAAVLVLLGQQLGKSPQTGFTIAMTTPNYTIAQSAPQGSATDALAQVLTDAQGQVQDQDLKQQIATALAQLQRDSKSPQNLENDRPTSPAATPIATNPPPVATEAQITQPDVAWLAQQDSAAFAIQLLTAMEIQIVKDYIAQHQLKDVRIIPTRNRFIAIVGSFPDRTAAATAASRLPLAVLSQGHWVRRIGDIQAEARQ
ncbi:hypothetical protein [Thiospirillum jenense]|uniref:SPOR domain-containing protein n=1 Tax=Thiospirillum jenense TaxID=1653858 RepID=A0A839H4U8_9GAMM|nr:hypothetical protein [Thiospirillum jenense]MBB1125085.1 hypothetical protein [Thiospirillum jenense]